MTRGMIGLIGASALFALAGCGDAGEQADVDAANAATPVENSSDMPPSDVPPDIAPTNSSPPVEDEIVGGNNQRPR